MFSGDKKETIEIKSEITLENGNCKNLISDLSNIEIFKIIYITYFDYDEETKNITRKKLENRNMKKLTVDKNCFYVYILIVVKIV